jgi:chemotaxis protein histidine kinase CheA
MLTDPETTDIYVQETNQTLAEIEQNLIILEDMGANIDMSLAKCVYHAMHVIRNGASLLSLSKMKELSQKIENVLGLICTNRLAPNPEVINILLQGIDRLYQLIDRIHSNDDMNIDEQSVLLTGLTSAVLPDDIKQSVTEVREIPLPDGKHVFQIPEFNLIQVLEQGKNIYILIIDLIKDVQKKNNTPFNFVRFIQQHGQIIDSVFDIQSVGTLEEQAFCSEEMPYFVLLASGFSDKQLAKVLELQSHQIKQVIIEVDDLIHPKTKQFQQDLTMSLSSQNRKTDHKNRIDILNALSCELKFAMNSLSYDALSLGKSRVQSVLNSLQNLLIQENYVLANHILWKIGRNIRDHAYQSNIQAKFYLECGLIKMDQRILFRLIDPLTDIIIQMIRHAQTNTTVQICLKMTTIDHMIHISISFIDPQVVKQETHLEFDIAEKKIHALNAEVKQSFELYTGINIVILIPQKVFIVPGYCVVIDDHHYIVPKFNIKECLTNLDSLKWRKEDSSIIFDHNEKRIRIVALSDNNLSYFKNKQSLIVCEVGNKRFGLATDSTDILEMDAVCQPLGKQLGSNPLIVANCLLDDGQIAFVLDMGFLLKNA